MLLLHQQVAVLQSELVTKENELQKTVFELQKTQAHSELLQLETGAIVVRTDVRLFMYSVYVLIS